ncbi:MAG: aspartate/tyrosine/aromatic aminotransferase [Chlamydiae bacterium]|nr:aspartate/tyrosine/aromatic aminotransferase [Chlamydiota bacterium]
MSCFARVLLAPSDPIFGLVSQYQRDPRSSKVDLTAGIYKNELLKTPIMQAVKKIEHYLLAQEDNKEYLPIQGDGGYLSAVANMVFGSDLSRNLSDCMSSFQTIGGTGALRIGGELIKQELGDKIYISDPSWPNHQGVFSRVGLVVTCYPYYNWVTHRFDFVAMEQFLNGLPPKSVVLLHAGCHNPSGQDPSFEQWQMMANLFRERDLIPFFDGAYLGFAGTPDEDAYPIRLFAKMGIDMFVAISFSKNFSLYGERTGALFVLSRDKDLEKNVASQLKTIVRRNYSNPPMHGMKIVKGILQDPILTKEWLSELAAMRQRIASVKQEFILKLSSSLISKDYKYLQEASGMFCFCSLGTKEVERLREEYAIYMTTDSRINLAGLISSNIDYVVNSIVKVVG